MEENLNKPQTEPCTIHGVMGSFKLKLQKRLSNVKEEQTWDEWQDGVKFGREDMIEEIIDMIDKGYLNCP